MDENMLFGIKFDILKEVAKKPSSASEISKKLKISLPYALTQLTILEAKKTLKVEVKIEKGRVGKPRKIYSITEPFVSITILGEGYGDRFASNNIDPQMEIYLRLISKISEANKTPFSEYFWSNIKKLILVQGVALIHEKRNNTEIIAITEKENLELLRKTISSYVTSRGHNIACWVHTKEEFEEGIAQKNQYYIDLINKAKPLLDKTKTFEKLKRELK